MKFAPIKNRKTNVLYLLIIFISISTYAQRSVRIGYIDTEYILQNVDEFNEASSQLNIKVEKWKSEVEKRLASLDQKRKQLNSESILLTRELIEERQEDIDIEEREILEYQQQRFGPNGDLIIQRRQLMQPIQDQIYNAVQEIASKRKYDFIFDKSADVVMLYSADRYNISDRVLSLITRSANRKQATSKKERREAEQELEDDIEAASEAIPTNSQEARTKALADKKAKRLKENEDWKAEREARKQVIKEERAQAAAEKIKAREAKIKAKKAKAEGREVKTEEETKKLTPREARQKALEDKKKKILEGRAKKTEDTKEKQEKTEKEKATKTLSPKEARQKAIEDKKKKILEDRKKTKDSTSKKNNN